MPSTPVPPSGPKSFATTSTASPAKKTRSAGKKAAPQPSDGDATLIDKSLQKTTRKAAPKGKPKPAFEKPAEAEWHRMISEAAYYRAERRGFQAGYEHEDWIWAEEEVRKILSP